MGLAHLDQDFRVRPTMHITRLTLDKSWSSVNIRLRFEDVLLLVLKGKL